ncbi:MAG: hypothetical protein ACYTGV_15750 [Planctomycetota bacterium]|jgi:hypothetical protein
MNQAACSPLTKVVLDRDVRGVNLSAGTLGAQLGIRPTLFVFLRHFG